MNTFNEYNNLRENLDGLAEVVVFEQDILEYKKTHPAKGMSKKKRSDTVKRAKRGEDMFGHGKNFKKIADVAKKRYGSEEAGKRVAGAIFWKKAKGKHMVKEDVDDLIWIIEDDIDVILDHAIHTQKELLK